MSEGTSFDRVLRARSWRPIAGCPGRWLLAGGPCRLPPDAIVAGADLSGPHTSPAARDPIFVAVFPGGGLISYRHADGRYLHTLCDQEGLSRKLRQLGLGGR